ncbi:STAS domain-containing protein [Amycolatopsis sp. 195334CR]|uniref:STAS domain-containing protein n=1 Tax=Amycolatopsis sp. 195334CR TaxID=2814588 RepID=UPI001A8C0D4C|nr:STAS domain-containing protein [Amycolatopsis sp. 195334CR]MBN6037729.1 STAS domain-containing protein [Amycolatopsis sp. 195334CR]
MPYPNARATMTVSATAEATVVKVSGEVDALLTPRLRDQLTVEIRLAPRALVVDFCDVRFCSSAGLAALIGACGDASTEGIPFAVATRQHAVLRPIELMNLRELLVVQPSVADALAWAARPLTSS